MSGPKSFKEIFADLPKHRSKYAIAAPIPPQEPRKTITQEQIERQKRQLKEMMDLVNTTKCPLCKSQLDGPVYFYYADVYCCSNGEAEYKAHFSYGLNEPQSEVSTIYGGNYAYEIYNEYQAPGVYHNIMYKVDLNSHFHHSRRTREKVIDYEGVKLFIDKNISEKKILKKIKLYRVFS